MLANAKTLIGEFCQALQQLGLTCRGIDHEVQTSPHKPHSLPSGKCAVYVFSLSDPYGKRCPAGVGRVLKVGKAGPKSNARFQSHHYGVDRALSTLAAMLVNSKILWPYLSIKALKDTEVADWIKENTDRDNFYLSAEEKGLLDMLETYLKGRFGPVFEG